MQREVVSLSAHLNTSVDAHRSAHRPSADTICTVAESEANKLLALLPSTQTGNAQDVREGCVLYLDDKETYRRQALFLLSQERRHINRC